MSDKYLSGQFGAALNLLSTRLLEMDGLVESQISEVLTLLSRFDGAVVLRVRGSRD
ncbi:hypothetical protein [Paraburkholderia hospita]|uniref:hypothetical protein n=1 Tax=Paraburkholderia hospita TaxID=169430 RepID=UPI001F6113D7|nr:hypothetical protein [Paraburkholderia hospita]